MQFKHCTQVSDSPLMDLEKLQYSQHYVIDKAEA